MEIQQNPHVAMRQKLVAAAQTGVFLAVLLAIQILGLPNLATGALVNAVFIFVLLFIGLRHALFLALLSPFGGMMSGHLPAPMYPLLPVIICGNFLLISIYHIFARQGAMFRIVMPAVLKALIIGVSGYMIIKILGLVETVSWLMFPVLGIQFATALMGLLAGEKLFQLLTRGRGVSA